MVPGISATLKGNPVGEASLSVLTTTVHWAPIFTILSRISGRIPDSRESAKIDPAWIPTAPRERALASHSGEAYHPASQ